jgi:hypothetical protein
VSMLVDPAVAGLSNTQVEVFHSTPGGPISVASAGALGSGPVTTTTLPVSEDGAWTVTISSVVGAGNLASGTQGLLVLLTGVVISLLLFVLTRLLTGSRERALVMVSEKTEELEFQALHDTLTGLPNRALFHEHLDHLLKQAERRGGADRRRAVRRPRQLQDHQRHARSRRG